MRHLIRSKVVCWSTIPIVLLLGFIAGDRTLDIQLADTYYVINFFYLTFFSILLLVFSGVICTFILNAQSPTLSRLVNWHLVFTIGGVLILMLICSITGGLTDSDNLSMNMDISFTFITLIFVGLLSIVTGVALIIIKLVTMLTKTATNKN